MEFVSQTDKPVAPKTVEALHAKAMEQINQQDYPAAIAALLQAVDLQPSNASLIANVGFCYLQNEQPDMAIKQLERVLELEPNWPLAHYNMGLAHHAQANYDLAEASFNKCLEYQPDHLEAKLNIATIMMKREDDDQAIALFQEILDREPLYVDARVNLATIYNNRGEARLALKNLDHIHQELVDDPDAFMEYAKAYDRLGDNVQTLDYVEKAQASDKISDANKMDIANLLISFRRFEKSSELCDELLKDYPEDQYILRIKNSALTSQGRIQESLETGLANYAIDKNYMPLYLGLIFCLNYVNPPQPEKMGEVTRSYDQVARGNLPDMPVYQA
ncbi:MAG: tetratricopeptide repeat protein, partial [Pseudomonadota bacterium]